MLWLEDKYVHLVSPILPGFTKKGPHTYNFRCPLCGDSQQSQRKARGYIYPNQQRLLFKCHNCNVALPFVYLLKRLNLNLYGEFLFEKVNEERSAAPVESPVQSTHQPEKFHQHLGDVPVYNVRSQAEPGKPLHAVYRFCHDRKLPDTVLDRLYATRQAKSWLLPLVGEDKVRDLHDAVPYLIQPLKTVTGWYGAQLRRVDAKEFTTFRWGITPIKLFGLDVVDFTKPVYVVEGPIDSLFIPNAIAALGSDLVSAVHLGIDCGAIPQSVDVVYVWDNEPRNAQVVKCMRHAVSMGYKVVFWPKGYPKDINDAVKGGLSLDFLSRVYTGLRANLELENWRK